MTLRCQACGKRHSSGLVKHGRIHVCDCGWVLREPDPWEVLASHPRAGGLPSVRRTFLGGPSLRGPSIRGLGPGKRPVGPGQRPVERTPLRGTEKGLRGGEKGPGSHSRAASRGPSRGHGGGRPPRDPNDERTRLMEELKRKAERICVLILRSDYPEVDIAIERARLREWCEQVFPDRMELYDMVYESRFDRLLEQFGADRQED